MNADCIAPYGSYAAGSDQSADAMPLRVVSHHESLDYPHAALVARGNDGLCLSRIQPDRLFAQHVFAGPEGP